MRLADDHFMLTLGDRIYTLRPTLRAAFYLSQKYDGFQPLYLAIHGGNLTAITDLIDVTQAGHRYRQPTIAELLAPEVIDQLLKFIPVLCGATVKSGDEPQSGEPMSFEEYFTQLYQIGTGWLGWTARDTWDATPAEIINAKKGRDSLLKSVFGGASDDTETIDATKGIPADVRAEINAIGKGNR